MMQCTIFGLRVGELRVSGFVICARTIKALNFDVVKI
jgi:hypothetical protein